MRMAFLAFVLAGVCGCGQRVEDQASVAQAGPAKQASKTDEKPPPLAAKKEADVPNLPYPESAVVVQWLKQNMPDTDFLEFVKHRRTVQDKVWKDDPGRIGDAWVDVRVRIKNQFGAKTLADYRLHCRNGKVVRGEHIELGLGWD